MNLYTQQSKKNVTKTWILMTTFFLVVIGLGYFSLTIIKILVFCISSLLLVL